MLIKLPPGLPPIEPAVRAQVRAEGPAVRSPGGARRGDEEPRPRSRDGGPQRAMEALAGSACSDLGRAFRHNEPAFTGDGRNGSARR